MRFQEIASRVEGMGCPVFGKQSTPRGKAIAAARRVVTSLEDRRVLYNPFQLEDPHHCIQSVLQIRDLLNAQLLDSRADLAANLRAMRAACRKFLDRAQANPNRDYSYPHFGGVIANHFFDALGELRGVFGVHLAQIAARYGVDVEDELASILPYADEGERVGK